MNFRTRALLQMLVFSVALAGCSLSLKPKYQSVVEENARRIIGRTKGLVWVADYVADFEFDRFSEAANENLLYWKPIETRAKGLIGQFADRYPTAATAAAAFSTKSAHQSLSVWFEPDWARTLDLNASQRTFRCWRNPQDEPGSTAVLVCQYIAQHDVWIHTTVIELHRMPTDIASIQRLIIASDRSLVR